MKKIIVSLLAIACIHFSGFAQGGRFPRPTPEQRVAAIHQKLDSAFQISAHNLSVLDTALTILYKQQDEKMKKMFSGGERPDRETIMAEMKKYTDSRDAMIKTVLTAEQFTIWKEQIEPSMHRRRGGMKPSDDQ